MMKEKQYKGSYFYTWGTRPVYEPDHSFDADAFEEERKRVFHDVNEKLREIIKGFPIRGRG